MGCATTLSVLLTCLKSCVLKVKDDVLRRRLGLQEPLFSFEVGQTGILFGPGKKENFGKPECSAAVMELVLKRHFR